MRVVALALAAATLIGSPAAAQTRIRIFPPDDIVIAAGQRFDLRVEATSPGPSSGRAPARLEVFLNNENLTQLNQLDEGDNGERGAGGTGNRSRSPLREVCPANANTTNFLIQDYAIGSPGAYTVTAKTSDGATTRSRLTVVEWKQARQGMARARNVILLLGDGMGAAHRTAARIVARGVSDGRPIAPLAMDRMPVTGLVMTGSLNSIITDSSPGMASYVTGHKSNNNQEGVYPDNTSCAFDNPRVEYVGELLRRLRGPGFQVGIVTTSDVTDATPAANAVHTAERSASAEIASRFLDERAASGITVLLGGGRRNFQLEDQRGIRTDERDLIKEFKDAGYAYVSSAAELRSATMTPPALLLGLFHPTHMTVAFDKVGAGRYSDELALPTNAAVRDQPMLDDMARAALASLSAHASQGFYLMIEGASIDKQAHAVDAERTIWDTIEFDNASVAGVRIPGFLVPGTIENGARGCETCNDTSIGHLIAGHTASDIPLSAYGPGMEQFTGTYDNTDVFLKILRAIAGSYDTKLTLAPARSGR